VPLLGHSSSSQPCLAAGLQGLCRSVLGLLDCADSQCQSTAQLKGPSSYLKASQIDYLREFSATFESGFIKCTWVDTVSVLHSSLSMQVCILLQVWRKGHDAEQELLFMHLLGGKKPPLEW